MTRATSLALLAVLCSAAAACGTGRRSEPVRGPLALSTPEQRQGQSAFMRACNHCHPMGDSGLGPALNNKPLPKAAVKLQVRKGMGAMPAFSEDELSDRDIDAIFSYLLLLRRHE